MVQLVVQSERNTAVDDIRLTPDFKGISLSVHSHAVRLVHGAHGQNALSVSILRSEKPEIEGAPVAPAGSQRCLTKFWLRMTNLRNPYERYSLASILPRVSTAELKAVSVQENLPPYAGYIDAEVPGGTILLRQQAADYYRDLQARAQQAAEREGVNLTTELVEGDEVEAIVECVQRNQSDLLVLGLHRGKSP